MVSRYIWIMGLLTLLACQADHPAWNRDGEEWKIEAGGISVTVHEMGGRITEFGYADQDLISHHQKAYGSTFWPSPQIWSWPPPSGLHAEAYRADLKGNKLILNSKADERFKLRVKKEIEPLGAGIRIRYTLTNTSDSIQYWAPWEITQLKKGGRVFYPGAIASLRQKGGRPLLPLRQYSDLLWYPITTDTLARSLLGVNDAEEGWIGYAYKNNLLVKQFTEIPQESQAPGEGEIEIFVSNTEFWEMEIQGRYQRLAPGDSVSLPVTWQLLRLPKGQENMELDELRELAVKAIHP